ncbi:hypothetical protein ACSW8S_18640 (plasmid) [Clostridium perfringens]
MNNKDIKVFMGKYGCSLHDSKEALKYADGNEEIVLAYLKAKTLAVATPNLSLDERAQSFLK